MYLSSCQTGGATTDRELSFLREVKTGMPEEAQDAPATEEPPLETPSIRMTSFEGAKGMSAQHVFVLGLEDGRFPARRNAIKSIDVRRMIVALTRTRKQCYLLMAKMSFAKGKRRLIIPSIFVDWIKPARRRLVPISAASFATHPK
jgi:superfamily I DNA/RNA helicase